MDIIPKKDDRVRVLGDRSAADWLLKLHGQEGSVTRDDGICAFVRFDSGSVHRIHHDFLELVEAGPDANPRRVVVNAPDPTSEWQPTSQVDLPILRNGDTLSITQTSTLGPDGVEEAPPQVEVQRAADPNRTVGQRYWRYDPENDEYATLPHQWLTSTQVFVDRFGVRIGSETGTRMNPGKARWLGNRLIEAAALFELLIADPPEAEGEPSITQANLLAARNWKPGQPRPAGTGRIPPGPLDTNIPGQARAIEGRADR